VPAGTYGCQVWGSGFLLEGDVFRPTLKTMHLNFLKGTQGVKRSAPYLAVLRECVHEPLQFYWFRAAIRFYISLLSSNSSILKQALHVDLKLVPRLKHLGLDWTGRCHACCPTRGVYSLAYMLQGR